VQQRSDTLKIVAIAVLLGGGAMLLRRLLIEPDAVGSLCIAPGAPAWCLLRQGLILGFVYNLYGYASVALALVALLVRRASTASLALAWLGLALGVLGCTLYRFDPAGAGVLLSALVLARLGASSSQGGDRQQQA